MSGRCLLTVFAVVLCAYAASFATISFSNNTLTYSSPSDLDTVIDPPGLNDVTNSYGINKAAFQALNPQVVAFNGAPAPAQNLWTLVVNYDATHTVTFTFPSVLYNYGSRSSLGRGAFSGSSAQDAISTVPSTPDNLNDWFDATISSTGGRGVQSLGFCAAFRNDQAVDAGQALFTLSDGTAGSVTLPTLGGSGNPEYVFIGYTAPAGKTIIRVQASRTGMVGGAWVSVDDLSFVMGEASILVGDINGDSYVNVGDLQLLVAKWGSGPGYAGPEDINGDGFVNVGDLQLLVAHWGQTNKDVTPPAAVSDLATSNPTTNSITLTWTAPADPDSPCMAYDIRYYTGVPVTDSNWTSATQVAGEPVPTFPGTSQSMVVTGLSAGATYYFAMKTADAIPNWSALSNVSSGTTPVPDTTPPAAVTDLATSNPTNPTITLRWTAPGDPDSPCTAYDIRYSTSNITAANFSSATQVTGVPAPASPGTGQSMVVSGLSANTTYYFAIKTADAVPNWSPISNVPTGTTTNTSGNNKPILGQSDFVYQGYYMIQRNGDYNNLAELESGQGFTHRYVGGQLRFLISPFFGNYVGGQNSHLVEFAPPAGGLGGTVTSRTNHWPDFWGGVFGPTPTQGCWIGLWYEQAKERLWTTWAIDYPDYNSLYLTRCFVVRTLNSDGTISNVQGPYGLTGVGHRRIYGGVQPVPAWFQSAYGTGAYCAGWGGYTSLMAQGFGASLGPTFYTFPEPTGYPTGENGIPSSAVKTLMDHFGGTCNPDWYAQGFPTSYDRGVRNNDVQNDFDAPNWQSPAPDGLGRWTWGDSAWNTGCWIETPTKQGFIIVPKLYSGRAWYQGSTLNCQRQTAEIQVFDPNMLGQVALGTRASWNTYPTSRWEITSTMTPLGFGGAGTGNNPQHGPAGASYDSTTQTLYVYCEFATNFNSYILVYHVN